MIQSCKGIFKSQFYDTGRGIFKSKFYDQMTVISWSSIDISHTRLQRNIVQQTDQLSITQLAFHRHI